MLNELIEIGKSFSDKFTAEYFGEKGISSNNEFEYNKWLGSVGTFIELQYAKEIPAMAKQILDYVNNTSCYLHDYAKLMGCLEAIYENSKPNPEIMKAINDFNN